MSKQRRQDLTVYSLVDLHHHVRALMPTIRETVDVHSTLPDPYLLWVSTPMSMIASQYSPDLPDWDFHSIRPGLYGIILWEGSTGHQVATPHPESPIGSANALGLVWMPSFTGTVFYPIMRTKDALTVQISDKAPLLTITPRPVDIAGMRHHYPRLWAMLGATIILSETPTVTRQGHTRLRAGTKINGHRTDTELTITKAILRESVPTGAPHVEPESKEKKWSLTHRHLVRGHWRSQPYGPKRDSRKPIFVPPYIKGPSGAELRASEKIHVWRR